MPVKKKKSVGGKKKKATGGLAAYQRKIKSAPAVKSASAKIKRLETELKATKKKKAIAVKAQAAKLRRASK